MRFSDIVMCVYTYLIVFVCIPILERNGSAVFLHTTAARCSNARSRWPFLVHVNVRARSGLFRNRPTAGVGDLSKAESQWQKTRVLLTTGVWK